MPRQARVVLAGTPLHIIQRGHNRQRCFFQDSDYLVYLEWLRKCGERLNASVHAYVLMTNHVHLLASFEHPAAAAEFMKAVGQRHTQYLNHRLQRTGTLWEGRYKSCPVTDERYLRICQQYIELNPVRAGMAATPEQYIWSSYRGNVGHVEDTLVLPHHWYHELGETVEIRQQEYRNLFACAPDEAALAELRRATLRNTAPGTPSKPNGRPKKKPGTDPGF